MTKQEVLEEATLRARAVLERAMECEPLARPDEIVGAVVVAPTQDEIVGIFDCCDLCRTGHCGQDCGHGALDQLAMTLSVFLDRQHDGCMCALEKIGLVDVPLVP